MFPAIMGMLNGLLGSGAAASGAASAAGTGAAGTGATGAMGTMGGAAGGTGGSLGALGSLMGSSGENGAGNLGIMPNLGGLSSGMAQGPMGGLTQTQPPGQANDPLMQGGGFFQKFFGGGI